MVKFVLMSVIQSGTDLTKVSFADMSVQPDDDILAFGMAMRTMLADSDDDLADSTRTPILKRVLHFYVAIVEKMVKIFPFHDTVLKDLSMLNPDPKLRDTWSPKIVRNYQLSPDDDLPAVKSDNRVDIFWAEMGHKKTFVGQ